MYNLGDDNELDHVSREAAGRYAPPGEANWQALNTELDKVLPVEKKKRHVFFFWWLLPILLIGGGTAYWLTQKDDIPVVITNKQSAVPQADKEDKASSTESLTGLKKNMAVATDKAQKQTAVSGTVKTVEKKNTTGNSFVTTGFSRKTKIVPSSDKNGPNTANATNQAPAANLPSTTVTAKKENDPERQVTKGSSDQPVKENSTLPIENKPDPAQEIIPQPEPAAIQSYPEKKSSDVAPRGKGLSFGLFAGIDKSTVKFKYGNDAGINLGVLGGYHFSDRLSVHTGAIYTQKNYKVAGADFTAPKGSWASYYKLENIEGYCRMWEVPLLLRYTARQQGKNSFFLSTGLSSYFMTRENYDYTYYNNNGQLAMRHASYHSTDKHILSIAHVSVGFENRISSKWSVQIEPYAKIPLAGVGLGNIRLSSFGLNFSVQYRQPAKK